MKHTSLSTDAAPRTAEQLSLLTAASRSSAAAAATEEVAQFAGPPSSPALQQDNYLEIVLFGGSCNDVSARQVSMGRSVAFQSWGPRGGQHCYYLVTSNLHCRRWLDRVAVTMCPHVWGVCCYAAGGGSRSRCGRAAAPVSELSQTWEGKGREAPPPPCTGWVEAGVTHDVRIPGSRVVGSSRLVFGAEMVVTG